MGWFAVDESVSEWMDEGYEVAELNVDDEWMDEACWRAASCKVEIRGGWAAAGAACVRACVRALVVCMHVWACVQRLIS